MTLVEFEAFYEEKGFLPNDVGGRKNELNMVQLKSRYEKYLKSEQKKIDRIERLMSKDEKWEILKEQLDLSSCSLEEALLTTNELELVSELKKNAGHIFEIIDPAHVFGKGAYPHMKYHVDNVVPLNRFSHSMLDQNRNPITGKQLYSEHKEWWWKFIVGLEKYTELKERSLNECY